MLRLPQGEALVPLLAAALLRPLPAPPAPARPLRQPMLPP